MLLDNMNGVRESWIRLVLITDVMQLEKDNYKLSEGSEGNKETYDVMTSTIITIEIVTVDHSNPNSNPSNHNPNQPQLKPTEHCLQTSPFKLALNLF